MNLHLAECVDQERWDGFVERSPQGTVFCRTPFLRAAGVRYRCFFVMTEGRPLLGALLFFPDERPAISPNPLAMYQGILHANEIEALPPHRKAPLVVKLLEFLLSAIERSYGRFCFSLHHRFPDLRAFSWFHYNQRELGLCCIDLRYSGLLDLATFADTEGYLAAIRTTRRQEYRKALTGGWYLAPCDDLALLQRLYRATFERQGLAVPEHEVEMMAAIARSAHVDGFGQVMVCRNPAGAVSAATVFLHDATSGYYLVGSNDPDYRKHGCGTFAVIENIRHCKERGLRWVDFVGVNSPNRGDFKTSLNGVPTPYYVVTWQRPMISAQAAE